MLCLLTLPCRINLYREMATRVFSIVLCARNLSNHSDYAILRHQRDQDHDFHEDPIHGRRRAFHSEDWRQGGVSAQSL